MKAATRRPLRQLEVFEDTGMPTLPADVVHGTRTTRSSYQYQFTRKHHGGDNKAAQWLPSLTLDEEFAVFNTADLHNLADEAGNLYGIESIDTDELRQLGTRGEQVAKYPVTAENLPWHGYPAFPLAGSNPPSTPPKAVLVQMQEAGLIDKRGRKRLGKGDPV
jgi:hypothetical protein